MAKYILRYLGSRVTQYEVKKKGSMGATPKVTLKKFRELIEAGRAYYVANNDDNVTPHFKSNKTGITKILSAEDWHAFFASIPHIVAYIVENNMLNHGEDEAPFCELYERFYSSIWAGVPLSEGAVPPPPPGPPPGRPSSSSATAATAEPRCVQRCR